MLPQYTSPLSSMVWNGASVSSGGQSPTFQGFNCTFATAFGNVSASTTITVLYSQDGVNFYKGPTLSVTANLGVGPFSIDFKPGAEFLALSSSNAATITAIISAK